MARFALRNKDKIVQSFGLDYYNLLIDSLKAYFNTAKEIVEHTHENYTHKFIYVPNVQPHTDSEFVFIIIRKTYNVYNLAYYSVQG
jgi:hypothetical protein